MDNAGRRNIHARAACRESGMDRQAPTRDRNVKARPAIALPQPGGEPGSLCWVSANGAKTDAFSAALWSLPSSASGSRRHSQRPHRPLTRHRRAAVDAGRRRARRSGVLRRVPRGRVRLRTAARRSAGTSIPFHVLEQAVRDAARGHSDGPPGSPLRGCACSAARQPPALR